MNSPRKPRLKGVFKNESMVSDTFNALIECGLRKLTRDLDDRGQTIFGEIPDSRDGFFLRLLLRASLGGVE